MNLLAGLMLTTLLAAAGARAQDLAPDALVKKTTDEIVAQIRKDKSLVTSRKLLDMVDTVVLPHFNFNRMTMLAVGRGWKEATPVQREQLVQQFRTLLVRTYSTALEQYSNQTIEVKPAGAKPADTETTVRMQINQPVGQPIFMDYRMEKTPSGWKVYDVSVEGVSIVTTYRSTFAAEISKGGIEGLIKAMTEQNRRLEARGTERK